MTDNYFTLSRTKYEPNGGLVGRANRISDHKGQYIEVTGNAVFTDNTSIGCLVSGKLEETVTASTEATNNVKDFTRKAISVVQLSHTNSGEDILKTFEMSARETPQKLSFAVTGADSLLDVLCNSPIIKSVQLKGVAQRQTR